MTQKAWEHKGAHDLVVVGRPGAEEEDPHEQEHDKGRDDERDDLDGGGGGEAPAYRPCIIVSTGNLDQETRDLWEALDQSNDPATLFSYGGLLARLRPDPVTKQPGVQVLDRDRVRNEVARRVMCCVQQQDTLVEIYPPTPLLANLMASRTVALPVLQRVVGVPVFSADGRLIQVPGYDEGSGVYYEPEPGLRIAPVPPVPGARAVRLARGYIAKTIVDFPFVDVADKAAAMTLLLEPFVREMIVGPAPLHLFEAPAARTGKSLLVEVLALPFCGTHIAISGWPTDEGEMRKRITSVLLAGTALLVFDNVDRPIASGNLASAITLEVWTDRVLRVSEMMKAPQRLVWVVTANNPSYSTEMAGRMVPCRLDAQMERPGERPPEVFHEPHLKKWARAHRRNLVSAALTLVQHWIAQGRPAPQHVPPMGGFEGWCEVLGGILEAAEIPGLLCNRDRLYEHVDEMLDNWRALVLAWWQKYGQEAVSTQQLLDLIVALELDWDWGEDGTALSEQSKRVRLGRDLGGPRFEMVYSGLQIRRADRKRHGAWLWYLHPVGAQAPQRGGSGESGED